VSERITDDENRRARGEALHSAAFDPIDTTVGELDAIYGQLRREQPVFYWEPTKSWVVTRYEDVATVLRDTEHFTVSGKFDAMNPEAVEILRGAPSPWGTKLIGVSEGADHERLRKSVSGWFMPRRMKSVEPAVRSLVQELVDELHPRRSAELITQFTYLVPINVILMLINFPRKDLQQHKIWSDQYLRVLSERLSSAEQHECADGVIAFQKYILDIVERRRVEAQDDAFSELVQARERGEVELSLPELVEIVFTLIFAGHETTSAMGANLFRHLLEDRSRWESVRANRETIPAVVEEALRFDGPSHVTSRWVPEPVELGGVTVQGRVLVGLFAANHDESRFACPAHFKPERAEKEPHFAFGYGTHYCLGAPLARLELRIMLEQVLERMPELRLVEGQTLAYRPNPSVRQLEQLLVEW